MKFSPSFSCSAMGALILGCLLLRASISNAQLRPDFYFGTCPHVFDIIGNVIVDELASDPRIAASILRLHFHDCFVNVRTHSIYISIYTKELTCSWTKYFTYHFFLSRNFTYHLNVEQRVKELVTLIYIHNGHVLYYGFVGL